MLFEIEVGAVGDAFELAPTHRKKIFDIRGAFGVVGQLVPVMLPQTEIFLAHAVARIPRKTLIDPALMPLLIGSRHDKEFDLHLFEFARAESEISRRDLIAERFADLRDTERKLQPHGLQHIVEVDENALRGFRSQIRHRRIVFHRTHESLEHQVKLPRLGQLTLAASRTESPLLATVFARFATGNIEFIALGRLAEMNPSIVLELVRAKTFLARPAIHHRVGEVIQVAARLPNFGMHEN